MYSRSITNLISAFRKLPAVGARTAERYVFHLLKAGKGEVNEIRAALEILLKNTRSCSVCWNFSDSNPCPICLDKKRDQSRICVVADPQDIPVIEKTGEFHGVYHVLRGELDPSDEESLQTIKISELIKRTIENKQIAEVILALSPDLPGETTMMYLLKAIAKVNPKIKITRLARGLPMGSDLQYADEITLGNALKNRN